MKKYMNFQVAELKFIIANGLEYAHRITRAPPPPPTDF